MRGSSVRWVVVSIVSLCLIVWARPGMTQSFAGWHFDELPQGAELQADGTAFFGLEVSARSIYVGESVPVEIEVGIRQGWVVSLNGLPALEGHDFTLNRLSKQAERRVEFIDGGYFDVLTWHTAVAAVQPGDFSLSAEMPLTAKVSARSAAHAAVPSAIVPKDIVIRSAPVKVRALPLPAEGRPRNFSGAVGDFRVSSDVSPIGVKEGEPLTLRLHVTGKGNFGRVEAAMLDHLDHWKTYPAKSSFTASDTAGDKGEKVFEQPLIAARAGAQAIPGLEFDYFSPSRRRYEQAQTRPIEVVIAASLPDNPLPVRTTAQKADGATAQRVDGATAAGALSGLRPDHRASRAGVGELRPLYFHGAFLALGTALALLLAGGWFAGRPTPARVNSRARARVFARLEAAARAGDVVPFFEAARQTLLQVLAARWQMPAEQITGTELRLRLGRAGDEVGRLLAVADEVKYSGGWSGGTDFQHWLRIVRGQLAGDGQ